MANIVWANTKGFQTSASQLEDAWRPTALAILSSIPSTWNGLAVSVQVNYTTNGDHSPNSLHKKGLAVDCNLWVGGELVRTYNVGVADPSHTVSIQGRTYSVRAIYSELLGDTAKSQGCRWGGDFGGGLKPKYDPMHFDAGKNNCPPGFKLSGDGDTIIETGSNDEPIIPPNALASSMYSEGAGNETSSDSQSVKTSVDNSTVYIGYGFSLSDLSTSTYGLIPINRMLIDADISVDSASALSEFAGLKGSAAVSKYNEHKELSISDDSATMLLASQVDALLKYLESNNGFKASDHPVEISTAIASYFVGKNMSTAENVAQVKEMLNICGKTSAEAAVELARYIETKSTGLPSDIKARRASEVQLLRNYNADKNTAYSNSITTTEYKGNYDSEEAKLSNQLNSQMDEIRNLLSSRKSSSSDPASSEYDETFNDVEQSTLDAVASLMQNQQVSTDLFFGTKERDYIYRMKTKNFYTELSRALNCKVTKIDDLMESESLLKNHSDYTLKQMYAMIPYSTGLAYSVKKNSVNRCLYRIRLIEANIKAHESDLIGYGCPSTNSYTEIGTFLATLPFRMTAVAVAELIHNIESVFGRLAILKEQLRLEKANLAKLRKDASRYA